MTNKYEPVDLKDGDIETAVSSCPDQKSPVAVKVEDVTTTEHRCRKRPFLKGVFVGIFGTLLALKLHMAIRHCHFHHHHHPGRFHDDLPPPPPLDIDFVNIPEDYEMKGKEKMWDDKFMQWDDEKMMKKKKMWHDKKIHGHHHEGHHHEGHHHEGHHHGHHHGMEMHGHQKHMIDVDEPEVDMIVIEEELNAPEEEKEEEELDTPEEKVEEIPVPSLAIMETNEAVEEVVRREESP